MKRSKTVDPLRCAILAGALMALAGTSALAEETTLADNWNSAGCSYTDTAELDISAPVHLKRVELWFNWQQDETSLGYTMTSGSEKVTSGTLTRGSCDPYQASWCIAQAAPNIDLAPGHYVIQVESARVCQNGGSGGKGFIKAYGEAASGAVQTGTSNQSASSESASSSEASSGSESEIPTSTALPVTVVTVLGSVLISLGAAVATGLSGLEQGEVTSSLTDIFKGNLPSDGFDDWKDKAGTIYGSGSPDDPYRDYPDADNPPWQAAYGEGTAESPYSDTAPPVIDHSPTPPDQPPPPPDQPPAATADQPPVVTPPVVETTVVTQGVQASGGGDGPAWVKHEQTAPYDDKIEKLEPAPEPPPDMPAQLNQLNGAMETAVSNLKGQGKFIANGSYVDKVRYGIPHLITSAVDWISDSLPDTHVPDPKAYGLSQDLIRSDSDGLTDAPRPPHHLTDPGWGQCGEAAEWGQQQLEEPVKKIFGNDAVFTQIEIDSNLNPCGNHIANEVITKTGERYVIDMWESMYTGKPKIYPESEWIEKWKSEWSIGKSATVTRGGGTSSLETDLTNQIRAEGVEKGIESFRAKYPGHYRAQADTVINSFKAQPWDTDKHHQYPPVYIKE